MLVAVTSQGQTMESQVDPRFGRAPWFLMVDTETMSFKAAENQQNLGLRQGAGIQSAQNLASHRPEVLLTGNCGPKAFKALEAAGVQVVVGVQGSVKEAVQAYLDGKYQAAAGANVEGHWV